MSSFSIRPTQLDALRQWLLEEAFGRLPGVETTDGEPLPDGEVIKYLYLDRKMSKRQTQVAQWSVEEVAALGGPQQWIDDAFDSMNGPGKYQARVLLGNAKQRQRQFDVVSATSQRAGSQSSDKTVAVMAEELRRAAQNSAERADQQAARADGLTKDLLEHQDKGFDRVLDLVDKQHAMTFEFIERLQEVQLENVELRVRAENAQGLFGIPPEGWAAIGPVLGPVAAGIAGALAPVGAAIGRYVSSAAELREAEAAAARAEAEALAARVRRMRPVGQVEAAADPGLVVDGEADAETPQPDDGDQAKPPA